MIDSFNLAVLSQGFLLLSAKYGADIRDGVLRGHFYLVPDQILTRINVISIINHALKAIYLALIAYLLYSLPLIKAVYCIVAGFIGTLFFAFIISFISARIGYFVKSSLVSAHEMFTGYIFSLFFAAVATFLYAWTLTPQP